MGRGGRCSAGWSSRLVWLGRPAYGGAHDKASTTSPHDTASTMSECGQALLHGKAERHNGEKPREAASGRTNGEEAARGGVEAGLRRGVVAPIVQDDVRRWLTMTRR
jgi:hypothetical protein